MNKVLKQLYLSLSEDDAFCTEEISEKRSSIIENYFFSMNHDEAWEAEEKLSFYTIAVADNAFEVGFRTAVQLLMGGGQA